ncbi:MAG: ferrochelatase [Gammaproteobacteria bacterium]|nr:ferrochelatase [Gammaproteobacteria bacterium]
MTTAATGVRPHGNVDRTGVLLTNLGTPDAPTTPAVRRYLTEFLSDRRVVELPPWLWRPILHGIVLRIRPRKSAAAYTRIWSDAGSPLLAISKRQTAAVDRALERRYPDTAIVTALGMRYGSPSIASALEYLRAANVQRLLVFPLYPQYSAATTGSTFDAVADALKGRRRVPELRFINHYHDDTLYIAALADSVLRHQAVHGRPDRLLISFHGLPKHYVAAGDPYSEHCQMTTRLLAAQLGLNTDQCAVSFQSRFGPREWLKPYTDKLLLQWVRSGITNVQVLCPGFSADCLETLEEIGMLNREQFLKHGGKQFSYIPALNDGPAHIAVLAGIIQRHLSGWEGPADTAQREASRQRAPALGADS